MLQTTAVRAVFNPRIDTKLLPASTTTASFTVELSGSELVATPLSGLTLDPDEAVARLLIEIRPLLAAAAHLKRSPLTVDDPMPEWIDTDDPARLPHRRPVGVASVNSFIIAGPTTVSDVEQRVRWATDDPLYAELLELLADAQVASNPRVTAYVMLERMETALGSGKGKRKTALGKLGLRESDVREIAADQSRFEDDRHGEHPAGTTRPPIDAPTRAQVVREAERIVRAYEEHVLGAALAT